MDWKKRAREILLAGGTLSGMACDGIPCGNANSDPCICGRPDESQAAQLACNQYRACTSDGGQWSSGGQTDVDGASVSVPSHCVFTDAASSGGDGGVDEGTEH